MNLKMSSHLSSTMMVLNSILDKTYSYSPIVIFGEIFENSNVCLGFIVSHLGNSCENKSESPFIK
ncbi:17704_t:CDS:2, partial [Racocetra persica]